ncbi:hypothetical protein BCR34DRAFT_589014 [Clohesyomyces aquaticus]|uniref:Uncharacterized protein n=1 Tax=Clohesyomyces aquaticus TaxID=1231657 RepID=A0A1Y1ZIZ7_9PLEO|nr:hypothetical protein BCR34DRAFT_589014 [Clohesyomyces aquaticus]
MLFQSVAVLALATGFAAASPLKAARAPEDLPSYKATPVKRSFGGNNINAFGGNDFSNNDNFNFFDQFDNVNRRNQEQVINIQKEQLLIEDNGIQQLVIQQVEQVIVIDNNRGRRGFNDLARKSNFRNNNRDISTVMIVVQEIQVSVDDGRGNRFDKQVFAQSIDVANRGRRQSETIMIFQSEVLIASQIIDRFGGQFGNGRNNNGGNRGGIAAATGISNFNASEPIPTGAVQVLGEKPTWSSVVEDPAATVAAAWEAELQDAQNQQAKDENNKLNEEIAKQEQEK